MEEIQPITLVILQARMSSSRLPGKVMMSINNKPMIYRQIERIKQCKAVNGIVVAATKDSSDDQLVNFLESEKIEVFRGEIDNVLSRFLEISNKKRPNAIIRLTGDCPLVMPELIDEMILKFYEKNVDYLSNTLELTFPDGLDIEIIKSNALNKLGNFELNSIEKEHVTFGIYTRSSLFTLLNYHNAEDLSHMRWTVDYQEDFDFVQQIYSHFEGREATFSFKETLELLHENKKVINMKSGDFRNTKLVDTKLVN